MRKVKVLGIIPARLGSIRLPKKMLADVCGKPLIYYTWKQAMKAKLLDEVVVATDSDEIASTVRSFGGVAMLTSRRHHTGSDRAAEAARRFKKFRADIVVNIQGDEPLIPPQAIDMLVRELIKDETAHMGTVAVPLHDEKKLVKSSVVKTVIDQKGNALYFSRSVIPYSFTPYKKYYSKLGLYAFRYQFLQKYVKLPRTPLEKIESLEQLRALEHGYKIKAPVGTFNRVEVNDLAQLEEVRRIIASKKKRYSKR